MSEASVKTAKINLGYTEITSPIAGKIGRTAVTKGQCGRPE
jgi:membrane fusion protein (multidrug efflux system)